MNLKKGLNTIMNSEKGYTGVDIAISVVVITIFISIITVLTYRFNSSSKEMELKSEALTIATNKIEEIKNEPVIENISYESEEEVGSKQGFYQKVDVIDASWLIDDSETPKIEGLVKKATVTVSYKYRNETKKVELSTIIAKEF